MEGFERYLTSKELAGVLKVSTDTIIRWFRDEPGVLHLKPSTYNGRKRVRCEIRIPEPVAKRVIERQTKQS